MMLMVNVHQRPITPITIWLITQICSIKFLQEQNHGPLMFVSGSSFFRDNYSSSLSLSSSMTINTTSATSIILLDQFDPVLIEPPPSSSSSSSSSSSLTNGPLTSTSSTPTTTMATTTALELIKPKLTIMAEYPGDIMLGAVFPIHQHDTTNYSCGLLQKEGIQQLEAMNYILDRINNNPDILPGIRLGALAIDSCDSPHHALEQIIDFIKSFVARTNRRLEQPEFLCDDHSVPIYKQGRLDQIVGIIGGQSSEVSLQLANLLRLFNVPQVSYMSTSPTLSDERLYQYFFRTVPSDTNQVDAIVDILRKFNWTYVSVVYSDTEYGNNGYDLLTTSAAKYNICISSPQAINVERFRSTDYDNLITTLMHKINARDRHVARKIMKAAKRRLGPLGRFDRFVWIASDAWCCRDFVVHGLEPVVEGTISVTPLHYPLEGFDDYFRRLKPDTHPASMNPWFQEFWEQHFNCRLPSDIQMIEGSGSGTNSPLGETTDSDQESKEYQSPVDSSKPLCNQSLALDDEDILQQSPSLHFVRDAFFAFAMTLHHIHQKACNGTLGVCHQMKELVLSGRYIIDQLKQVEFRDEGGRMFRFQSNGDAPPRYTVVNFQRISNGTYQWRPVGTYMIGEKDNKAKLKLEIELLKFKHGTTVVRSGNHRLFPKSYCSEPCAIGQAKLQLEGDTCCWLCTNCSQYQYLVDEFHCDECPLGTLPDKNKTQCHPVPTMYLSLTEWWTISSMIFAVIGMLATISTWIVFLHYSETPIIKASGRELSNLHLAGIFLSFAVTFVIISKPTPLTCALTRFLLGFCYTVCYSAIVTKTNRISRIFQHRSCQKPRFTSPRSQLIITSLLISVEVFVNVFWFFFTPPDIKMVYSNREIALLICSGSDHFTYLFGLLYPLILIGFCTVYAFKTRKCPEGFNEARYITFTNYTTCVVWFAFLPLYVMLSTTTPLRAITLSSLLSVSGAVQLSCLFVPKMYIALLKPEKNTRETVMCGGTLHRSLVFNNNNHVHNHVAHLTTSQSSSFHHHHLHHYHHHHHSHHHLSSHAHQSTETPQQDNSLTKDGRHQNGTTNDSDPLLLVHQISNNDNHHHHSTKAAMVVIEPYSTSSEVDTTMTNCTTGTVNGASLTIANHHQINVNNILDTQIIDQQNNNNNNKIGSILSMPDRLTNSVDNDSDKNKPNAEQTTLKRRPLSAGATASVQIIPNATGSASAVLLNESGQLIMALSSSSSASAATSSDSAASSTSPSPFPLPATSSAIVTANDSAGDGFFIHKHDTKAVLENGHHKWPSIKLEAKENKTANNKQTQSPQD